MNFLIYAFAFGLILFGIVGWLIQNPAWQFVIPFIFIGSGISIMVYMNRKLGIKLFFGGLKK